MNKLKLYVYQHPVMTALMAIGIFTFITEAINLEATFANHFNPQSAGYLSGILVQGLASVALAFLIGGFGLAKLAGFTSPKEWKQLWIVWPIVALSILAGWSLFDGSLIIDTSKPLVILLYLLVYLSTGFYEELLCRGFVMPLLLRKWGTTKKGLYLAVMLSSVLFGLLHLVSFFLGRISLLAVVTQVLYATFIGLFFAACILRINSIWPAIIFHALFNISSDLKAIAVGESFERISYVNTTFADATSTIIVTFPFLIYGLFLLRKVKPIKTMEGIFMTTGAHVINVK